MIVDIDVASIDTREEKNKIVFHLFLWKIATLSTWDDHWKNGFNDKHRCLGQSIFIVNTGKKNTDLRQWSLILASLHVESIFHFLSQNRRKNQNTDTTGQVNVFLFFCLLLQLYALDHWKILDSNTTRILTITPPSQK